VKEKRIGRPWLGRVQLAVTQDLDKAAARYPWAVAFVQIKNGFWCFESKAERDRYWKQRTGNNPVPGTGKAPL